MHKNVAPVKLAFISLYFPQIFDSAGAVNLRHFKMAIQFLV